MDKLLSEIKSCKICDEHLPLGARPVLSASPKSKILVVGQAPGIRVHNTGIPWNDPSGDNLRNWLNVDKKQFYNTDIFAIVPMGFCYPGAGQSGDLPPRKECAITWHEKILSKLPNIELILLIGLYAQKYYLKKNAKKTLTETVKSYEEYLPIYLALPHPSPRNNIWMKKNEWFAEDMIPLLQSKVREFI